MFEKLAFVWLLLVMVSNHTWADKYLYKCGSYDEETEQFLLRDCYGHFNGKYEIETGCLENCNGQ